MEGIADFTSQAEQPPSNYEQERQEKQSYLIEHIANKGFDTTEFAQYMEYKKVDGTNIDNWTMDDLKEVVQEFAAQNQTQQRQDTQEEEPRQQTEERVETLEDDQFVDIENENTTRFVDENVPSIKVRQFAPTSGLIPTEINYKKAELKVTDWTVKKGGFFSSDYVLYTVSTQPTKWKVGRKDADFYTLRKLLRIQFPHILVPPLPIKNNKMTDKVLNKRQKQFQRFLQAVARSEELKSSGFLCQFLNITDLKEFQKAVKAQQKIKEQKSIESLVTMGGRVEVQMIQNSSVFCSKMLNFTDSYQILYQEVIEATKEVNEKSAELAQTMYSLSKYLEQLSELNRMIKVDRVHELYAWLSKMVTGTGNHVAYQGELILKYLGSYLKYHMSEHESFRELYQVRESVKVNFIKKERALFDKKERLFRAKDMSKWGYSGSTEELIRRQEELFSNKEKAFKFMLTEESQQLEKFREELSFYTNQCLSEVRRVGTDNGQLLTDHFITLSSLECTYINKHHVMWADFLSHFTEVGQLEDQAFIVKQQPRPESEQESQQDMISTSQAAEPENAKEKSEPGLDRQMTKLDSSEKFSDQLEKLTGDKVPQAESLSDEEEQKEKPTEKEVVESEREPQENQEEAKEEEQTAKDEPEADQEEVEKEPEKDDADEAKNSNEEGKSGEKEDE